MSATVNIHGQDGCIKKYFEIINPVLITDNGVVKVTGITTAGKKITIATRHDLVTVVEE